MESVGDLSLSLPNAVYSIILAGTAFVYETTFSILIYVLNSFGHIFDAAFGMFSIVLSFISGTFIMILSCFNFVFSAITSIFNGILTIISSLKYASLYFGSYFLQLFLTLDTKRVVLLLFLVVMVWQLWKMRQRRLAFEAEWKRSLQHRSSDRNASYLSLPGTSWKSGNFEGKQPNFSHIPSWESGDFNRILDFALRELCHRCRGNISAGPLHFTDKVPLLQTNFTFKANDCVLKHLDTTHRVGCATTREESGGVLVLDATIALRKLTVSITNYWVQVGLWLFPSICVSGDFVGTVESLTLRMEVALTTPFAAELRSLSITNMGPPQVHITGLGVWALLWKLLQSSLLSRKRLENFIIPIFERVLQDLTSYVSAIPTPRQEVKRLHWDEMTLTRQIEVQTKVREDITIQTIKYGTRQNEIRPRESTSSISRYQSESSPWDSASTIPQYQSESSPWNTSSTRSEYRTEDFPWEETTIRRTRGYESSPWDTASTRSGYRTEDFPWEETTIRRTRGYESSPWDTASTRPGYRSEVFPTEETTIRRIREYESNHRDTRQMRLAMAPAPRPPTETIALGVTAGVVAIGAICGITAAVMSSRSRSNR